MPQIHREVSKKTTFCPHCGTSLVTGYKNIIYTGGLLIVFALISWKYFDTDLYMAELMFVAGTGAIVRGLIGLLKRDE